MCDLFTGLGEIGRVQGVGDIGHMQIETALRDEHTAQDAGRDQAEGNQKEDTLERKGDAANDREQEKQRDGPGPAPRLGGCALAIKAGVKVADETAHPCHRVTYSVAELLRIAGDELGQQSQKR